MRFPRYQFCSRYTKSLKMRRIAASPTPGVASGLLHETLPSSYLLQHCQEAHAGPQQYPGLQKHGSRPSLPSTPLRLGSKPPLLPTFTSLLHVFWGFFIFYSSPHFTPASSAWGLEPSWQKVKKFRREHTWQTGLPSLTKQTKLKAIPTLQASHPKDNANRNSLASNSKHPRLKGVWLGFLQ